MKREQIQVRNKRADYEFQCQDFKSATTGVAAKAMRNELNNLVAGIEDPVARKVS